MSAPSRWSEVKAMVIRHKTGIKEALVLFFVLAAAAFFAFEVDIFANAPGQSAQTELLELDEVMALATLLVSGLLFYAWRRLKEQKRETARRITAEREARSLAMEDPLTGLPNRRQFDGCLKDAMQKPPRQGAAHAVLTLDLNGFKKVNDVHGHPVGDELLIKVGALLRQAVRDGDLVARLGGDEFAVLATHISGAEAATGVARRIIDALAHPTPAGGAEHRVGCAIGIALSPQDGSDGEELMRKADIALYRAKAQGGSTLRFFEEEMDAQVRERDYLERELRAAIGTPQLRPHYQPQIALKTGRITGFEALARWTHPELGEIPPERFIPIADDCGLISALTEDLLTRACTDAAGWPKDTLLSFNISPVQLRDGGMGLRLMKILADTGLPPQRLEIELTESALVRDMDSAREILGALRDAGVKIALDDFGTGYSSLYHLRNFKLDKIKIDRSFVESMNRDPDSAAIVKALVGLGAGLNLTVTAEGVEDAEQQAMLAETGCEQAQGFLFSQAVPAEEALAMVANKSARRRA
jgi:diguanylate cyclase (GGDEF)-like protein